VGRLHEVKFDGWGAQLHVGADITKRFRWLRAALSEIPCRQAIIDCDLVACGLACVRTLMDEGIAARCFRSGLDERTRPEQVRCPRVPMR
jgi:hypothetical protein